MNKARETIGFGITQNESPGVFSEKIVERKYYVDKIFDSRKYDQNNSINGSIDLSNKFSIVCDPFARENYLNMRYITWMGVKWRISTITVDYPRLTLSVSGEFNG